MRNLLDPRSRVTRTITLRNVPLTQRDTATLEMLANSLVVHGVAPAEFLKGFAGLVPSDQFTDLRWLQFVVRAFQGRSDLGFSPSAHARLIYGR
jgi:hypothetical protein